MVEQGLRAKHYLTTPRQHRNPLSALVSSAGLLVVVFAVAQTASWQQLLDLRSLLIVVLGTAATLLFQYDFATMFSTLRIVLRSFAGTPDAGVLRCLASLDRAIIDNDRLTNLRDGDALDGELLNDIVYMYNRGLLFEEIDEFVTTRIADEFLHRRIAAAILRRAALVAPALGLFGTVIGLTGVLRSMNDPGQIGPSMALALMTTAYGAGLGSLLFTPLSGRLDHHNTIFLETHKQLLSKVGVLLSREERQLDSVHAPVVDDDAAL